MESQRVLLYCRITYHTKVKKLLVKTWQKLWLESIWDHLQICFLLKIWLWLILKHYSLGTHQALPVSFATCQLVYHGLVQVSPSSCCNVKSCFHIVDVKDCFLLLTASCLSALLHFFTFDTGQWQSGLRPNWILPSQLLINRPPWWLAPRQWWMATWLLISTCEIDLKSAIFM